MEVLNESIPYLSRLVKSQTDKYMTIQILKAGFTGVTVPKEKGKHRNDLFFFWEIVLFMKKATCGHLLIKIKRCLFVKCLFLSYFGSEKCASGRTAGSI